MKTLTHLFELSTTQIERFFVKVNKLPGGCWVWTAAKNKSGYGVLTLNSKTCVAHRVSYFIAKGEIPEGLALDHLCKNTLCVNPDHLDPVTQKINVLRGTSIVAKHAAKTHCNNNHEYSEQNTYFYKLKNGETTRRCKICHTQHIRDYYRNRYPTVNGLNTHCQNRHEFTEANTYFYHTKKGTSQRRCKTCKNSRELSRS